MASPVILHSTRDRAATTFETLRHQFGWRNPFQATRLEKIVVQSGTGRIAQDRERQEFVANRLALLTGQKPVPTPARKSIASFKTRKGLVIGWKVTLRRERMWAFLDRLVHLVLPRTRDFHGIAPDSIDPMGNLTVGIAEHIAFPECGEDDVRTTFGVGVTLVTSAKSREEAEAFFRHLGLPLKEHKQGNGV